MTPFDAYPFNTPITPGVQVDVNSAAMLAGLAPGFASSALANDATWGIPVYKATYKDPWYTLRGSEYFTGTRISLHLPAAAAPNAGSDGHMVIVGPSGQWVTEFWQFKRAADGTPSASSVWQSDINKGCSGQTIGGVMGGVTASKISLLAGLLRASDLAAPIPHALAITVPATSGDFRWPAQDSDGKTAGGIPMGARLQLDSSYTPPASMPAWQQLICLALQQYGAFVMDSGGAGGGVVVMAESSATAGLWPSGGVLPGSGVWPAGVGGSLADLPWDQLSVLA